MKLHLLHLIFLFVVSLSATSCANRLSNPNYEKFLVGEAANTPPVPAGKDVRITYLGTNGYLIQSGKTNLVVDPYFSRFGLREIALNAPISPVETAIAYSVDQAGFPSRIDGWLVTHSHFDHLLDVPYLQRQFGGKIITSRTGKYLCEAAEPDIPARDILPSKEGDVYYFGKATVRVLSARHDQIFGQTPYPGVIREPLSAPPTRARDWKLGTPLAFLIEIGGKRIYVESGGMPDHLPNIPRVDLAIIGTATGPSQRRYAEAVRALQPRFALPSHQDDFFTPLERGFNFAATANFPRVKASHEANSLPGQLILMDYFQAWTLD